MRIKLGVGILLAAFASVDAAVFTVVSTNDSGGGSLRQAILDANGSAGMDTIVFGITNAALSIAPASVLPVITDPVVLDAATQPGFSNAPIVEINGSSAGAAADGLRLSTSNSLVRGLVINRFTGSGIRITNGGNNVVEGAIIGLNVAGTADLGNSLNGILITNSANNVIGGIFSTQRNIISGNNQNGVLIQGLNNSGNAVRGNYIGLGTDGLTALGNGANGINLVGTANTLVGGALSGARNVISANSQNGVSISGVGASNNVVSGNFIGTDADGTLDLGNAGDGINVSGAPSNTLGGAVAGAGNLISGNNNDGVELTGAAATNNLVIGNRVGTDFTGTNALGNGLNGVQISNNARSNAVGTTNTSTGNLIAFNAAAGVAVPSGTNNTLRANLILANGALGIDLGGGGLTPNDPGDADTGANQLQNFPVITNATIHSGATDVSGTLNSRSNASFVIDFFANLACDPSGSGEGQQYLGSTTVTTGGGGDAAFGVTFPVPAVGRYLTATATDTNGNTSEFAACFAAASTRAPVTLTVTSTNDSGAGSLRQALVDAGTFPSSGPNLIAFNLPGPGPHTLAPISQLPTPSEPVSIDGYSQPGSSMNTLSNGDNAVIRIRLDGGSITGFGVDGLRLRTSGNIVRGLAFIRWASGGFGGEAIDIAQGGGNRVAGCFFGMDVDGSDKHNFSTCLLVSSPTNEVGGTSPADRNVISYNWSHGVALSGLDASNNLVRGNFIGTDLSGTLKGSNFGNGVDISDASANVVGGTEAGARNLICGNQNGVSITGPNASANIVRGNLIGTDITGTTSLGNMANGILVSGGGGNEIGGATTAARNILSGNSNYGLRLDGGTINNNIRGNLIGVDTGGIGPVSNSAGGILLSGASSGNRIGGTNSGEGNRVGFNALVGIAVVDGAGNAIRANPVFGTAATFSGNGLGLDLGFTGVAPNDPGDGDLGANNLQNFPLLTNAFGTSSNLLIQGTINSVSNQTFDLDFFANAGCDPTGYGEGEFYLGRGNITTDSGGNAAFSVLLPIAAPGAFITATATDTNGNTSEFSPCLAAVLGIMPLTFTVTTTNDSGPGSLREAILSSNGHVTSSNNIIAFNIPGPGMRVIRPLAPLPLFTQAVTIDGFTQPGSTTNSQANGNNANWLVELDGGAMGANQDGLRLTNPGLVVGGLRITRCSGDGIEILSSNCVVAGNLVCSNSNAGIHIAGAGNMVGGVTLDQQNVISANVSSGVYITGETGRLNRIVGNLIGTDPAGVSGWGAQLSGVNLFAASGNFIGGPNPSAGNVIAFHADTGVLIQSGTNNAVRGNRIFSNSSLGFDLSPAGITSNDADDADEGANRLQNFPVLTNVIANVGQTIIQGSLTSHPVTTYWLDAYTSLACSPYGYGEGQFFLGSGLVNTDGSGNADFSVNLPATIQARFLTATVTDPDGNTSEFSSCIEPSVVTLPPLIYFVTNTNDSGPGSLRQALLDVVQVPNTGADSIQFAIPGTGIKVIQPLTPLPPPGDPTVIDGYTQPGAVPNSLTNGDNAVIRIRLDGALLLSGTGLQLTNGGNTVRGLSVTRFPDSGLWVLGNGNSIEGNWIGLDPGGAVGGNSSGGVLVQGAGNIIGGLTPGARNVISGNSGGGLQIWGSTASNNTVLGNLLGAAPSGTNALGNSGHGIYISGAGQNRVGATNSGGANVIAGNTAYGLRLDDPACRGNTIEGNFVGVSSDFAYPMGNGQGGVVLTFGASSNTVGGFTEPAGNVFAYNGGPGAWVQSGNQNAILANQFLFNTGKPISIAAGANDNVQPPILTYAAANGGSTVVSGFVQGQPNTAYEVTVMADVWPLFAPPSQRRQRLVGTFTVMTDAFGSTNFTRSLGQNFGLTSTREIFLNLTRVKSSSEYSFSLDMVSITNVDLVLKANAPLSVTNGGNLLMTVTVTNLGPSDATDVVVESIKPPGAAFAGATNPGGTVSTNGEMLRLGIGPLAAGQGKVLTLSLQPGMPGFMMNYIRAYSLFEVDATEANDYARVLFTSLAGTNTANLAVGILPSTNLIEAGFPLVTLVTVTNSGPASATETQVGVTIPPLARLLAFSTTQGTALWTNSVLFYQPGLLPSGTWAGLTLTVVSDPDNASNNVREIAARAIAAQPDFDLGNNLASTQFMLLPPRLSIAPTGALLNVTYSTNSTSYHLEFSHALAPPAGWQPLNPGLLTTNGPFVNYSFDPGTFGTNATFFRLATTITAAPLPFVIFYQLDQVLDHIRYPFSEWGAVDLTFSNWTGVRYVNLALDTNWVVRNVPVVGPMETNSVGPIRVHIPITTNYGRPAFHVNYGLSATTNLLIVPPPITTNGPVFSLSTGQFRGETNRPLFYFQPKPLVGGAVQRTAQRPAPVFPNHDQGTNECAPAAVLNSLEYLDGVFSLNIPTQHLTMDAMKIATDWSSEGALPGWWDTKDAYMRKYGLPIVTETTTDPQVAMAALTNNYDVEMSMDGHATCVRVINDIGSGDYAITVSDDLAQGRPWGAETHVMLLYTGYFWSTLHETAYGSAWCPTFRKFIIERPQTNSNSGLLLPPTRSPNNSRTAGADSLREPSSP